MQFHSLKRKNSHHRPKYVGRGGKRGKTAGRGTKGQNARAGRKKRPEMRDIIKKLPKLRGRGKNSNVSIERKPFVVNLEQLEKAFTSGDTVSPKTLLAKGVIELRGGKTAVVKILGDGTISKKLIVSDCLISKPAKEKLVAAGGSVVEKMAV